MNAVIKIITIMTTTFAVSFNRKCIGMANSIMVHNPRAANGVNTGNIPVNKGTTNPMAPRISTRPISCNCVVE